MGNKNGFDPAITRGTQTFLHLGRWSVVCYWGSGLSHFTYGDTVFFQNQYGEFWLGTIERDCFMLICENPLKTVLEGFSYLSAEYDMYKAHEDNDDWFCDQGELPF